MSARSNLISLSTTQFPNTELPVFWLSPNPFAVAPNLNASCLIDKPVKIEIFSISGQMISQTDFYMTSKVHQTLNGFSGLPAGMYIVRVSTQDHLEVLRAVKQ
jgi:hypothetical protein